MEEYSDLHRSTLQTIMNHGVIDKEKLQIIFYLICGKFAQPNCQPPDLSDVIDQINARIARFDQKIFNYQYGLDLVDYYMHCSTAKTSVSKMQHCYNNNELEFFKSIFKEVIHNEELSISPREALNLSINGRMNKVRAEKLIDTWSTSGYFVRSNNLIYLGPKSLTEFKEDLKILNYDHLKSCVLCDDIAAWGIRCNSCKTAVYHKNCIEKFLARSYKCPSCKKKWTVPLEG